MTLHEIDEIHETSFMSIETTTSS